MIPKIIHYFWFGRNPKPELVTMCIESWRKYCPDYEIIEWNEDNYDIHANKYCAEAYQLKRWAFVTDVARLDVVRHLGGIYLDTDVELIRSLDSLLEEKCFLGFENNKDQYVATGLGFGAEADNPVICALHDSYQGVHFIDENGEPDTTPCTKRAMQVLKEFGVFADGKEYRLEHCHIYPKEYFSPINYQTGEPEKTENTYSIHHYAASWHTKEDKICNFLSKYLGRHFVYQFRYRAHKLKRILFGNRRNLWIRKRS